MTIRSRAAGRALLVASATAAALLFTGPAHAAWDDDVDTSATPPDAVMITAGTSNGSGCPGNTARVTALPNNTGFTVTYRTPYLAHAGIGARPTDFRKFCQVNLQVTRPEGYTYAIAAGWHRGFASVLPGATGMQRWQYYFQGAPLTEAISHTFTGPYSDDWSFNDRIDVERQVWAPCSGQRNLNVHTELRASAGTSDPATASFLAPDWSDNDADAAYRFVWKRCR
jgi:hypothetical protein